MATARVPKKYRIDPELAAWYADQAEARGVSENLLVTRALEHYRQVLPEIAVPPAGDLLEAATAALDAHR